MKKLFSSILALAMILSLFTFTVQAAATGSYEITYEDASGNAVKLEELAANDVFYAKVTLKNTTLMETAALNLAWNSAAIVPVESDGTTVASSVNKATSKRLHSTIKDDEDESVYTVVASSVNSSTLVYELFTTYKDENRVSGSKLFLNIRFKVVGAGVNPELTATVSKVMEAGMSAAETVACVIPAYTTSAPADPTKEVGLVATLKYDNTKTGVKFTVTDTVENRTSAPYPVSYAELVGTIENLDDITVGLNVTDVPETSVLTATAELY